MSRRTLTSAAQSPLPLHRAEVLPGDCLDVMRALAAEGRLFQSIVTDPPAGIGFMGKAWDGDRGGRNAWVAWMRERAAAALALVPPGGHALVWALPRTSHWTATAWEDAGWEVRDRLAHLFGSGFPKSHDVSKAIDREAGAAREVVGFNPACRLGCNRNMNDDGWKGVGVQGAPITAPATEAVKRWAGWGTALKPACEDWWLFRKPLAGTVAANVLEHGTGALNIEACRIGTGEDRTPGGNPSRADFSPGWGMGATQRATGGRWPANLTHDGSAEVEAAFAAFGERATSKPNAVVRKTRHSAQSMAGSLGAPTGRPEMACGDTGTASRFFYCAKAGKGDRAGSAHPTVKPVALMRWLVRLITPPGGAVLDPFGGSGTTAEAAVCEGLGAVLIESDPQALADARARLAAIGAAG